MTRGIPKKRAKAEQLRKKRMQAAPALVTGAKKALKAEVKNKAEFVVLAANQRIGEEIKAIKKISPPGKKDISRGERTISVREELTGVKKDARSRLGKLAAIPKPALKAINPVSTRPRRASSATRGE